MNHCLLVLVAALAACSTTPVPGVCCIGPDDCNRLGLAEDRTCPVGQACVEFQCVVPSCSTQGCAAEAPVCDVAADVCTGCTESFDCSRFSDTTVCDPQTGGCVECLVPSDCTTIEPVCEDGSCRGCRADTECPSGACGEDGACVNDAAVIYLHPAGQDIAPCSRSAPCKELQFAIFQTTTTRNHVVMTPGSYAMDWVDISPTATSATAVFIHGHGARLYGSGEAAMRIRVYTTIRDLSVEFSSGAAFLADRAVFERVHIRASTGIQIDGPVIVRNVLIESTGSAAINNNHGDLILERSILVGGRFGIRGTGTVDIKNLLVYGTSDTALDLAQMTGLVSFTTIADTNIFNFNDEVSGIRCPPYANQLRVHSSIFWTPGSRPAAIGECGFSSSIAGPMGAIGAMNLDPLFVDAANRNYRLSAGSPVRDMVDTGPAVDFEGDRRPRGARFDIGADEAP
jgi:hypothetical protein